MEDRSTNNVKVPYKSNFSEIGKLFISSSGFLLLEYESNEKKTREIYSMEKRSDFNNWTSIIVLHWPKVRRSFIINDFNVSFDNETNITSAGKVTHTISF